MKNSLSRSQWKVIFLSSLGGMLEFYDFVIFAIFALPIGEAFFPNKTPIISVMAAFGVFAVGYLARPIGGIIFSHFGDKYGRKKSFMLTIVIMGAATFTMGLLPSYHDYGPAMSILFLLLRIIQGIAVGGEIPGSITFVFEHVRNRAGLSTGIIFLFINLGIFLADAIYAILNIIPKETMAHFSPWRIAFIIGGLLSILSYFLRTKLNESPEYLSFVRETNRELPLLRLIKSSTSNVIFGTFIIAIQATLISLIFLYTTQYMKLLGTYTHEQISIITLTTLAVFSASCAFWGWISDLIGHKKVLTTGTFLLIPFSYFYYHAIANNQYVLAVAVSVAIVCAMVTGTFSAVLANLFSTGVRYSGIALCYNIGFAIFGGLTPLIATYLIHALNNNLMPAYLIMVVSVLGLAGIIFSKQEVRT